MTAATFPPSVADRPFALPPDWPAVPIVLDVPVPPSVNRTRRSHGPGVREVNRWHTQADATLMASGQYRAAKRHPPIERFEVQITLSEDCRLDLDNPIKAALDYLRRIELIRDDDKRYFRRLVVCWGAAPSGCRIVLRETAA